MKGFLRWYREWRRSRLIRELDELVVRERVMGLAALGLEVVRSEYLAAVDRLRRASATLHAACFAADIEEELSSNIDGSMLDAVDDALVDLDRLHGAVGRPVWPSPLP